MNRTTKALARLGSLAVIAGTVLSTPFALGTANAGVNPPTVFNGRVTSTQVAANSDWYTDMGTVQWTATHATTFTVVGAGAFLPTTANEAADTVDPSAAMGGTPTAGNVTITGPLTGTCAVLTCTLHVGSTQASAVTVAIADTVDAGNRIVTVNFNGLFNAGCPQAGLDADVFGDSSGGAGDVDFTTPVNCVTQGQYGTPLTLTTHYGAGGVGGSGQNLIVSPDSGVFAHAQWSGGNTSTCTYTSPTVATCTTDAQGNVTYSVADVGVPPLSPESVQMLACTNGATGAYPNLGPNPAITTPAPFNHRCAERTINFSSNPVGTTRLDLTSAQMIAPSTQDPTATKAQPGDAVQLMYHVSGGCTPVQSSPALSTDPVTCTGPSLSGVSVPLSIDHGFFTPNCSTTVTDDPTALTLNNYGACSFATAPAAGGQVGNLTNSGTTKTVTTNISGNFVVTIGIGRDTAFDNNGVVVASITSGTVPTTIPGDTRTVGSPSCTSSSGDNVTSPTTTAGLTGLTDGGDCTASIQWTTQQQPLNGGTAKLQVVKALALPNNDSIDTQNNYNATDSGTVNVPDTARVVWQVNATDQFGNLTSYVAGSAPVKFTLTGVGGDAKCAGSSPTNACTGPAGPAPTAAAGTCVTQPDGSNKETGSLAGTYLNLPVGLPPATTAAPQVRYQSDVNSPNCSSFNGGYSTGTPGVIDGTQTTVVSWAAPTTTFATVIAPGIINFASGTAAAATDTLTLNFYNQLAQPVVTFTVLPGNKVATSTAVTIQITVVDQFGNPIVGTPCAGSTSGTCVGGVGGVGRITAVRSGQNEASCVPTQGTTNGGAAAIIFTNTSGVAGYTFSCNAPGVSTVSFVVTGPGGTQLSQGKEAVTFTGAGAHRTVERPTVSLTSFHRHHLTVNVHTDPALGAGRTVNIYRLVNGIKHLVGQTHTGPRGNATLTFTGLRQGAHWRVSAKVIGLGTQYRSEFAVAVSHRVK